MGRNGVPIGVARQFYVLKGVGVALVAGVLVAANFRTASSNPPADGGACVNDVPTHAGRLFLGGVSPLVLEHLKRDLQRPPALADVMAPQCFTVGTLPDLDGDGQPEADVSYGCIGVHVASHLLYLSNHGCPKLAGAMVAAELEPVATTTNGVRDLESRVANGCAGGDFSWEKLGWNGHAYAVTDRATCSLCYLLQDAAPPGPDANRHPYCRNEKARLTAP